jgi:hypothetical protein
MSETGACIVCGEMTSHRQRVPARLGSRPYSHWRCASDEHDQCADRRDAKRHRPKHRDPGLDLAIAALCKEPADAPA